MQTAITSVRAHLRILIENYNTLKGYEPTEETQQLGSITEMRIEAGITFIQNPLS